MKTKNKPRVAPSTSKPKAKNPAPEKIDYKEHWKGMPAFDQEDLKPFKSIIVNFESAEGLHKFAKVVGQLVTMQTRFIWYPEVLDVKYTDQRWSEKKKKK